ncbi:MAG TPA: KH domain-containing protein [Candidatus Saccharimonadales bacterium]|nr:KH domain-containing protein [Candidatus Saccharimonadales bacterium]
MSSIDQQFVEFIVKSLVSRPDAVSIERRIDEKGVLLELTVDPEDLGRVIGKRGATAQSLRTLLRALGTKNDARYNLKIVDNGEGVPAGAGSTASDDNDNGDDDVSATGADEPSSVVSKTRKELEELDDLDV